MNYGAKNPCFLHLNLLSNGEIVTSEDLACISDYFVLMNKAALSTMVYNELEEFLLIVCLWPLS